MTNSLPVGSLSPGLICAVPEPSERRAHLGRKHDLPPWAAGVVVEHELSLERAPQRLEFLREPRLRREHLQFELFDTPVHVRNFLLERKHPLDSGEVEPKLDRHLLDASELLDVLV